MRMLIASTCVTMGSKNRDVFIHVMIYLIFKIVLYRVFFLIRINCSKIYFWYFSNYRNILSVFFRLDLIKHFLVLQYMIRVLFLKKNIYYPFITVYVVLHAQKRDCFFRLINTKDVFFYMSRKKNEMSDIIPCSIKANI